MIKKTLLSVGLSTLLAMSLSADSLTQINP